MEPIVERTTRRLAPLDGAVREAALTGPDHHGALAARVPALDLVEWAPPPVPAPVPRRIRVAAWNAERLKFGAPSAALLDRAGADVALLGEVDLGMARSGNRHTVAELAAARGCGYVYGVEFVEIGLGDTRETRSHAGETNGFGYHGNAILSRFRLADPVLVRLEDGGSWFDGPCEERRLGGRMALAARLADAPAPLWVAVVHLENRSDPALRAAQVRRLLDALMPRISGAACVLGGDLNTLALPRGDALPPELLADPSPLEPLFTAMAGAGFRWARANTADVTCRTRPDGEPRPPFTRIDWLFVRGLGADKPATVPALDRGGNAISDHDLVAVDVVLPG